MDKKGNNFFEEHVEKIVLGVIGLVCLWLLIMRVVISPNYVEYEGGTYSASDIDNYINKQAEILENKLDRNPQEKAPYKPQIKEFSAKVDSAISDINVSSYLPVPPNISEGVADDREYSIPVVGKIKDIGVNYIRAVAYVPVEEISEENIYSSAAKEPNDIDLVTVEAKFDVGQLYDKFRASFDDENIPEEWRDPCLAQPVFAAVQLQRQELRAGGSWSNWEVVPRLKIDHYRKLFEVKEDFKKLGPGGVKVYLFQFDNFEVKTGLLQPEAYGIASAKQEWFPPSFHKDFVRQQQSINAVEKREAREAEREERSRERAALRPERRKTTDTRVRTGKASEDTGITGKEFLGGTPRRERSQRGTGERATDKEKETAAAPKPTTDEVRNKFEKVKIAKDTNFAKMREPLLFWAHDDSVEPGKNYRYRIRLGVFNPIAGTNYFSERDKGSKNDVVLWSDYSDITDVVEIPATLYIFPCDVQEATKTVTVQVSKYVLGYWYSKSFNVKPGEAVGKPTRSDVVEEKKGVIVPQMIDCTTGAVLVDVIPVNDWSGSKNLSTRYYFDMLYSFNGVNIEHIPIKKRYWSDKLQNKFNEIAKAEKEPKEPLREWGSEKSTYKRSFEAEDEFLDTKRY